jgi:transposase
VRRLEVFTGAGRRRAWPADEKARIVAESFEGGETVSAVARRHALTPQQLFAWRRAAQQRAAEGGTGSAFAPVIVEATGPYANAPMAPAHRRGLPLIEVVIGAATVRIAAGIDAGTLTTVLRAVRALT